MKSDLQHVRRGGGGGGGFDPKKERK